MTIKEAKAIAKQHGYSFRKTEYNEYRTMPHGGTEAQASYEATAQDAIDTLLSNVKRTTK